MCSSSQNDNKCLPKFCSVKQSHSCRHHAMYLFPKPSSPLSALLQQHKTSERLLAHLTRSFVFPILVSPESVRPKRFSQEQDTSCNTSNIFRCLDKLSTSYIPAPSKSPLPFRCMTTDQQRSPIAPWLHRVLGNGPHCHVSLRTATSEIKSMAVSSCIPFSSTNRSKTWETLRD